MFLLDEFISVHPKLEKVELIVVDPGGVSRGKWAPTSALKKAFEHGVNFPLSIHGLDVWGNEVEKTGLHIDSGDADGFCLAVPHTLAVVPWGSDAIDQEDATTAQVILQTFTPDHETFGGCSRTVLQKIVTRFEDADLTPVCAFELEFHLLRAQPSGSGGRLKPIDADEMGDAQFMYDLDALSKHFPIFSDIRRAAEWAQLPLDTIVKEAGPGQFEVNLTHRFDAMKAADDVILLKRIVRESARKHGYLATFMAKPFLDQPGNGMHVHTSLLNNHDENVFAGDIGRIAQGHAVRGMIESMEEMTLPFINSYNGFRRLSPSSYAPTRANWGENNRSVALRLPVANDSGKRIEHRVSGADANPYLVLAAILQGMLDGLEAHKEPPPGLVGNAYDEKTKNRGRLLPNTMREALDEFENGQKGKQFFGAGMHKYLTEIKKAELQKFEENMSTLEKQTYLS